MSTYGAKLRARINLSKEPEFYKRRHSLPMNVLDEIAEQTMNEGYTKKRNPVCPICHTQKSNSGICFC